MFCVLLLTLATAATLYIFFNIWCLYCNEMTYQKRMSILDSIQSMDNPLEAMHFMNMLSIVRYDRHLHSVIYRKDWRDNYKQELKDKFPEVFK